MDKEIETIAELRIIQNGWNVAITRRNPPVWNQYLEDAKQTLQVIKALGYRKPLDSPKKLVRTEDCPVYLESQCKKWNPDITPDQYPCNKCPFKACKQEAKTLDRTKLHEWGSPEGLPRGWRGKILKGLIRDAFKP